MLIRGAANLFADGFSMGMSNYLSRRSEIDYQRSVQENDQTPATELDVLHGSQDEDVTGATLVFHSDGHPTKRAANGRDVETETVAVGGVFYAIGHTPNTEFLEDTDVDRDEAGYILTQTDETGRMTTRTTVESVFAAGDVADPLDRRSQPPEPVAWLHSMSKRTSKQSRAPTVSRSTLRGQIKLSTSR